MPNFDGTHLANREPRQAGPQIQGPLTGRRRGRCRDDKTTQTDKSEATNENAEDMEVIYRLGRGGRPRGGAGNRLSGGFGQGAGIRNGKGRRRGFGNR